MCHWIRLKLALLGLFLIAALAGALWIGVDGTVQAAGSLAAATATPQPAPVQVKVVKPAINLRSGPGTAFAIVGTAKQGATFPVTGKNAAGTWYQITRDDGTSAWLSGSVVELIGAAASVPVAGGTAAAPAAGAATPTPKTTQSVAQTAPQTATQTAAVTATRTVTRTAPATSAPAAPAPIVAMPKNGAQITLGDGSKIVHPFSANGSPDAADNAWAQTTAGGFAFNTDQDGKLAAFLALAFKVKQGSLAEVTITDVSDAPFVTVAHDTAPALKNGKWSNPPKPVIVSRETTPWMYASGNSLRIFRITLRMADGQVVTFYQPILMPGGAKKAMLATVKP